MAYLIERKSQTIFVTATSIIANGKPREMIVESRPEYAVVQLAGVQEKFPVPWEEVYAAARKRHEANLRIEGAAMQKRKRCQPIEKVAIVRAGNNRRLLEPINPIIEQSVWQGLLSFELHQTRSN